MLKLVYNACFIGVIIRIAPSNRTAFNGVKRLVFMCFLRVPEPHYSKKKTPPCGEAFAYCNNFFYLRFLRGMTRLYFIPASTHADGIRMREDS